jgi:hypothetical protein
MNDVKSSGLDSCRGFCAVSVRVPARIAATVVAPSKFV